MVLLFYVPVPERWMDDARLDLAPVTHSLLSRAARLSLPKHVEKGTRMQGRVGV